MTTKQCIVSLKEYDKIARRIIVSCRSLSSMSHWILKDSEFIGEAVNELIIADREWNGKGTIYGYRKQRVKWKMLSLVTKRKRNQAISLSTPITDNMILSDIISDKHISNDVDQLDFINFVHNNIDNSGVLTNREKECILLRHFEDMTLQDIGDKLNISKEAARQNIKRGLSKIQI